MSSPKEGKNYILSFIKYTRIPTIMFETVMQNGRTTHVGGAWMSIVAK